jgi:hypothetical protein
MIFVVWTEVGDNRSEPQTPSVPRTLSSFGFMQQIFLNENLPAVHPLAKRSYPA